MSNAAVTFKVAAPKKRSRVRRAFARYRHARRTLRTPASRQSRHGLDWTNFFIADLQTGFGTFVAFYLASLGWSQANVGFALGLSGFAGVFGQIPGGALADSVRWKRALVAIGVSMICAAALILALWPTPVLVFAAEILHGLSSGVILPTIAAISLGLVGRRAMSLRTGRNFRFSAAGTALTAITLGAIGSLISARAIFLVAAAICAPALIALSRIRSEEIDYRRARNAAGGQEGGQFARMIDLAKNRHLLLFAACIVLFQFANASILPLVSESLAARATTMGAAMTSSLIVGPQIIVAFLAPWVGYCSETWGRRPLLVVGIGLEAVRATLFSFVTDFPAMIAIQLLDGVSGAIINVLTVLIIADLTAGTGRFNLAQGVVGAMTGIAASTSIALTGLIFDAFGRGIGFLIIGGVAAVATAIVWMLLPETKPEQYQD